MPLGDYMSGSNHVLPTGGTAPFAAGLGIYTFVNRSEVIEYDEEGLKALAARINAFAVSEDLPPTAVRALRFRQGIRMTRPPCASRRKEMDLR